MTKTKTTVSELAENEVHKLTSWLLLKMNASTDGESGVISINCDFIKRLITELRRLEKENGMLISAIRSPELYVGIITEQLEQERDDWAVRCKKKQSRIEELEKSQKDTLAALGACGARPSSISGIAQTRMTEITNIYERMQQERERYAGQHAHIEKLKFESLELHKAGCDGYEQQQARIEELEEENKELRINVV